MRLQGILYSLQILAIKNTNETRPAKRTAAHANARQ
jgi:hypothetical protein